MLWDDDQGDSVHHTQNVHNTLLMLIILRCEMLTTFVSAMNIMRFSKDGFGSAQCMTHPTNMPKMCDTPHRVVMHKLCSCASHRMLFTIFCFVEMCSKLFVWSFVNVVWVILEMLDTFSADPCLFFLVLLEEVADGCTEVSMCRAHIAILMLTAAHDTVQEPVRKNVSVTDHCLIVINHFCESGSEFHCDLLHWCRHVIMFESMHVLSNVAHPVLAIFALHRVHPAGAEDCNLSQHVDHLRQINVIVICVGEQACPHQDDFVLHIRVGVICNLRVVFCICHGEIKSHVARIGLAVEFGLCQCQDCELIQEAEMKWVMRVPM